MMAPLSLNASYFRSDHFATDRSRRKTTRLPTPASTPEAGARVASAAQNALHVLRESRAQTYNNRVNILRSEAP